VRSKYYNTMKLSRFLYLFYYLRKLDRDRLKLFLAYASEACGKSKISILSDSICSVLIYNISILDYFYFRFFQLDKDQRRQWAGTGFLYEYQLKMNPKDSRDLLEDKNKFLRHFSSFIDRKYGDIARLSSDSVLLKALLANDSGKLVLKNSHGQVGAEVEVVSCEQFSPEDLLQYMRKHSYNLAEEYVIQHPSIMELSASGLNTVRIFTQLHMNEVVYLGARFRISVNSPVDNMGAGNLAASVNIETGEVNGPGVYSDITKTDENIHPVSGKSIYGFKIPHWKALLEMAKQAALHSPENRSVGWDIAVIKDGPELIEGNHNWCKLLWQLPVKEGMKSELEKYF